MFFIHLKLLGDYAALVVRFLIAYTNLMLRSRTTKTIVSTGSLQQPLTFPFFYPLLLYSSGFFFGIIRSKCGHVSINPSPFEFGEDLTAVKVSNHR